MTIGKTQKKAVVKRLHFLKGQIEGIERMINTNRSVKEVYGQLKAVEKGLHQAIYVVLDGELKKHFAQVLAERLALCPGDCDDAERLQFLRTEFAKLNLSELIDELAWLRNSLNTVTKNSLKEVKTK